MFGPPEVVTLPCRQRQGPAKKGAGFFSIKFITRFQQKIISRKQQGPLAAQFLLYAVDKQVGVKAPLGSYGMKGKP